VLDETRQLGRRCERLPLRCLAVAIGDRRERSPFVDGEVGLLGAVRERRDASQNGRDDGACDNRRAAGLQVRLPARTCPTDDYPRFPVTQRVLAATPDCRRSRSPTAEAAISWRRADAWSLLPEST
jgi:hypothetical protein